MAYSVSLSIITSTNLVQTFMVPRGSILLSLVSPLHHMKVDIFFFFLLKCLENYCQAMTVVRGWIQTILTVLNISFSTTCRFKLTLIQQISQHLPQTFMVPRSSILMSLVLLMASHKNHTVHIMSITWRLTFTWSIFAKFCADIRRLQRMNPYK